MVNKYWDPKYSELIGRVEAWNALEEGIYDNEDLIVFTNPFGKEFTITFTDD